MAKRKQRVEEKARELTRKELHLHARDRERNGRLYLGTGIAIGLALLVIIAGLVMEFAIKPNSVLAKVGDDKIITKEFWKRTKLEKTQMENQLGRLQQLEQQFGGQSFFTQQISQLQSTLSSPFALGMQVLNNMIDEKVVAQQAKTRGITVTEPEVDKALREEVAGSRGAVTAPQATATAEAGATATAEAQATAAAPTTPRTATNPVSGALGITTSKVVTTANAVTAAKSVTTVNAITASKPVTTMNELTSSAKITSPTVVTTKAVTPTKAVTATTAITTTPAVTATHPLTTAKVATATKALTATAATTASTALTNTDALTVTNSISATPLAPPTPEPVATRAILTDTGYTEGVTTLEDNLKKVADMSLVEYREVIRARLLAEKLTKAIGEEKVPPTEDEVHARHILVRVIAPTPVPAASPTPLPAGAPKPPPPPAPRTEAEAMALAKQLREQIVNGAKFEDIAAKFSEDTSNAAKGGDLGWFGPGAMVKSFEDAAFALKVNEISQPITTTFGVHLIQVLEKDPKHKLDDQTLTQKRNKAYQDWLQEQINAAKIERPEDLTSKLPRDLQVPTVPQQ